MRMIPEWKQLTAQQRADYVQGLFIALRDVSLESRTAMTVMKRIGMADGQQVLKDAKSFLELELRGWLVDQHDVDYIWRMCRGKQIAVELLESLDVSSGI